MKDNSAHGNKGGLSGLWLFLSPDQPRGDCIDFLPKLIMLVKDEAATEASFFFFLTPSWSEIRFMVPLRILGICVWGLNWLCVRIKCHKNCLLAVHHAHWGGGLGWDHGQGTGRGQRGFEKRTERVAMRRQKMCVYEIFRAFAPWLNMRCKRNEEATSWGQKNICRRCEHIRHSWEYQHVVSVQRTIQTIFIHSLSFHFSWWGLWWQQAEKVQSRFLSSATNWEISKHSQAKYEI